MLRSILKGAVALAVSATRLDTVARGKLHRRSPLVLSYHRVVEELDASEGLALPSMEISVATLERHLDWLARHFRIVSIDDLQEKVEDRSDSRPVAAVTFDDGYSDIYHHAFPLLRRKGIPAGIFVITDLVGSTRLPIHERLHALLVVASRKWMSFADGLNVALNKANVTLPACEGARRVTSDAFSATQFLLTHAPETDVHRIIDCLEHTNDIGEDCRVLLQPLSWEMLAEMREAGMTIGSHSRTHAFLTNESPKRAFEEAETSRRELENRLGVEIRAFAYPGGVFNRTVVQAVAAAGYRYAFTICRHRDEQHPLLTIPRIGLWERSSLDPFGRFSPSIMSCQTAGAFNWLSTCRQVHSATSTGM